MVANLIVEQTAGLGLSAILTLRRAYRFSRETIALYGVCRLLRPRRSRLRLLRLRRSRLCPRPASRAGTGLARRGYARPDPEKSGRAFWADNRPSCLGTATPRALPPCVRHLTATDRRRRGQSGSALVADAALGRPRSGGAGRVYSPPDASAPPKPLRASVRCLVLRCLVLRCLARRLVWRLLRCLAQPRRLLL